MMFLIFILTNIVSYFLRDFSYFLQYAHSTNSMGEADGREGQKKNCKWLYKGSTVKNSKKTNIASLHLLFASIERRDSALSNDIKSKFSDAIFDFIQFFEYLRLRPLNP